MTDLIARLRGRSQFCKDRGEVKSPDLMNEAADRIEELEAKLTEAVAGLRKIADYKHFSRDQGWIQNTEARIASATLAELEGGE